jgi:hypothetical protein
MSHDLRLRARGAPRVQGRPDAFSGTIVNGGPDVTQTVTLGPQNTCVPITCPEMDGGAGGVGRGAGGVGRDVGCGPRCRSWGAPGRCPFSARESCLGAWAARKPALARRDCKVAPSGRSDRFKAEESLQPETLFRDGVRKLNR